MTETREPIRALIVILLQCSDTITVYYRTTHRGRVTTVDTSHNISIIDFLVYQHFFTYIYILGESLVMKCTSDTEWSSCNWVHEIEDQIVRFYFIFRRNSFIIK